MSDLVTPAVMIVIGSLLALLVFVCFICLRIEADLRKTRARLAQVRDAKEQVETELLHLVAAAREDQTERERIQQQLRQAQKMAAVGRLATGVAHDFNNILTIINGFGELLHAKLSPSDPGRRYAYEISLAGGQAANLIRQILFFSRQQPSTPQDLDLNTIVLDTTAMLRHLIGENIQLVDRLGTHLGTIFAESSQIQQVIMNLAINGRDAMPRGGKLTIETTNVELDPSEALAHGRARPGHYVLLRIADTGIGVDPAAQSQIFEPFFTTKAPDQGIGLGLATVQEIVRAAGGHVVVTSKVGQGTTFDIYLPRRSGEPAPSVAISPPRPPAAGTETVLLVEDDAVVRSLVCQVLEAHGYTVLETPNAEDARWTADRYRGPIHLLITDVVLPNQSGYDLAKGLRALRPCLRVLYTSGYTTDDLVQHEALGSHAAFLQKPFLPIVLARKVRQVLDEPEEAIQPARSDPGVRALSAPVG